MTTYDWCMTAVIVVGMGASGSFLWRFRPSYRGRFNKDVMPLWFTKFALFLMFLAIAIRIATGLTDQPESFLEAVLGLGLISLIDAGLVMWALMYRRQTLDRHPAAQERRSDVRRASDATLLDDICEMLDILRDMHLQAQGSVGLGERIEANQKVHAEAVRHLVEVTDKLRQGLVVMTDVVESMRIVVAAIQAEGVRVAGELEVSQKAVEGVAQDLHAARGRADAIESGNSQPGEASDAGARNAPSND